MKRIDSLKEGDLVTLKFCAEFQGKDRAYTEDAEFNGITGTGNDRQAHFSSLDGDRPFSWHAYRFNGRWAYGSSAETLRLVEVKS